MKIENVEISDSDETDVDVTVIDNNQNERTITVQTFCGEYRGDLGCLIKNEIGDEENFEDEAINMSEIISSANKHLSSITTKHKTDKVSFEVHEFNNVFTLVETNYNFINSDTSSYQKPYEIIKDFDSLEEAREYLANEVTK